MIQFLISAAFVLVFLFVFVLLASGMFWVAEYIRNQLEEDYAADQISIKEYVDPFTGDKNKKA